MASSSQLLEEPKRSLTRAPEAPVKRVPHPAGLSLGPSSDRRLADRASNGDRRAIAAIFERYQQELYGFCLGILGKPEDAQDALQNTMVKVLKALPGEEREIALRPWLYRIAHNEAVELRRTARPTQALEGHLVDGQSSVVERAEQREKLGWLLKDLADLPGRQRAVLVMRELNGLAFAEIGAALDTSPAVVRQSLYEARRNLEQMGHGRGLRCDAVARVLSNADGRTTRRRDIRAHLRDCPDCRHFQDAIESRRGILATIPPLPAAAAAGLAQAVAGSSSSGMGAALTGSVAKSAGAYGALKAAATVAAVAVLGTSTIQYGLRGEIPGAGSQHTHRDAPSNTATLGKARAGQSARSPHSPRRFSAAASKERSSAAADPRVAGRRSVSPGLGHSFAATVSARPADAPPEASFADNPPAADVVAEPRPESSSPQGTLTAKGSPPGQKPDKQTGQPPKAEKKVKPEHPPKAEKQSPGQTKKAAQAEEATPETEPASPAEEAPEAVGSQPPAVEEGTGPSGTAKGHEKQFSETDPD